MSPLWLLLRSRYDQHVHTLGNIRKRAAYVLYIDDVHAAHKPYTWVQVVNTAAGGRISSIASGTAIVENGITTFDHLIISGGFSSVDLND